MNGNNQNGSRLVMFVFLTQVIIDWTYVCWINRVLQPISSAWFAMLPLFTFLIGFFTLYALLGMYQKSRMALAIAFCVLLFGTLSALLSYNIANNIPFRSFPVIEFWIIPIIMLNFCAVLYMAWKQRTFKED